jgi:protein involved in polysaccharide export with SLBB domain
MESRRALAKRVRSLLATGVLAALASFPLRPAIAQDAATPADDGVNPVLQPGDKVRLRIWREPDLSGEFAVDERGVVVFPKIGPVAVGRLTTDSVKSLLVANYTQFLQNPSVEVVFLRRINVLGWVKNPGLYYVDPTMTLADALALAGGVNPDGNSKKIALYRDGAPVAEGLSEQSLLTDLPLHSGDQLRVPQRSWLSRNAAVVVGATISATGLIAAALIRF